MPDESRKQSLIAELASARTELHAHALGVSRGCNLVERVKRGVKHRPALWFGGAALLGLLLSKMGRSKRQIVKVPMFRDRTPEKAGKAAIVLTALKFGLDFARPALMKWVKNRIAQGGGGSTGRRA